MRVLSTILKAVRTAAVYNPEVQVTPACILWLDHDHHLFSKEYTEQSAK
jgi:hypothetical protein